MNTPYIIYVNKDTIRQIKTDIIRDINKALVSYGKQSLSTGDFDILYDLEIDQLLHAQGEILEQLRGVIVEAN